jgi:tripartite-type tricarboxylate transporter receptor subunit TctC
MNTKTLYAALMSLSVLAGWPVAAQAQMPAGWPAKPLRIVVPYATGGAVDTVARLVGQRLGERLGQSVLVDNRPGGAANIGMDLVAKAAPDGYTLLLTSNAQATNPSLFATLPFDPQRDLAPIGQIGRAALVVVVPAASPAKSFKELVAEAKAAPGKLTYASAGNGSSGHLAGEALKQALHLDVLHVPYKGGAPALTDLLGERISFMPLNPVEVISHIRAQKLRALAVTGTRRMALLPEVPTVAEAAGVPEFDVSVWWGLAAPAATSPALIARLNGELQKVLAEPALQARLAELGVDIVPGSAAQFGDFLRAETARWGRVVKAGNIKPD